MHFAEGVAAEADIKGQNDHHCETISLRRSSCTN